MGRWLRSRVTTGLSAKGLGEALRKVSMSESGYKEKVTAEGSEIEGREVRRQAKQSRRH